MKKRFCALSLIALLTCAAPAFALDLDEVQRPIDAFASPADFNPLPGFQTLYERKHLALSAAFYNTSNQTDGSDYETPLTAKSFSRPRARSANALTTRNLENGTRISSNRVTRVSFIQR